MKTQLRIMAILMGALVSGAAISGNTQPARSTMTVNPGASAGTQGTGGQVIFNGSITDSSCNVDSGSTGQTVDLGKWASSYLPAPAPDHQNSLPYQSQRLPGKRGQGCGAV